MIYGTDESRYQSYGGLVERIEGGFYSFVLLNVDDPGFVDKATLCESRRYVWGVYVYMLPGTSTDYDVDRVIAKAAPIGSARGGFWFDYEEPGVELWQLARGFQRVDDLGVTDRWGYYASNGALDHGPFLTRRFWLAQYPPNNDGSFPGFVYLASRPVDLWQYTSGANDPSGVGLDRNVVIDEAWWAALTGQSGSADVGFILAATSDGDDAIWPGIVAGSRWADVETRFLRGEGVAGPVVSVDGNVIAEMAREKDARNRAAADQLGGTTPPAPIPPPDIADFSDEALAAEVTRRLTA